MHLIERPLFASELLTIRHAIARPTAAECSDLAWAAADLLLLPIAGVFALHDAPRQHFIANPNHGLFLGLGQPYRISFPGRSGDECLVLQFSEPALADMLSDTVGAHALQSPRLRPHCLLSSSTVLERSLLWHALSRGEPDVLAIEERCITMLETSLHAAATDDRAGTGAARALTQRRRLRQIEDVKEAISLFPAREWTLDALARLANTTPHHLARVFREEVGIPIHRYLVRTRLGKALEAMQAADSGLTGIALDAGFSSHSHFTASFRSTFGMTPAELRSRMSAANRARS